jgi:hypothetical protein
VVPLRRDVRLERHARGRLRVGLAIDDAEPCKWSDLAQLLCALYYEFGGFHGFWVDGREALPSVALGVICLRSEGYDDLAGQAWQRHMEDMARPPDP